MQQTSYITAKRIRGASIFKLCLLGNVVVFTLFFVLAGLLALFDIDILKWQGGYVTGFKALIVAPLAGVLMGVFYGLLAAVFTYVGLRIYSFFRPVVVEYIDAEDLAENS